MHLSEWSDHRLAEARHAVADILESDGLRAIFEVVESHADSLVAALMNAAPSDEGAKYAADLAEIRAFRSLGDLLKGLDQKGVEAEARLRETAETN